MAAEFPFLEGSHQEFIKRQQMFFVATAPLSEQGHVNLSPKGYDTFRILSERQVAYLDVTGSGNETSAHLLENGRITIMFIAYEGNPMILRLYGRGRVILPNSAEWESMSQHFELIPSVRQIIVMDILLVKTSCGCSIPEYDYVKDRDNLKNWATKRGEQKLNQYRREYNSYSMDGLPTPLGLNLQNK